MRTMNNNIIVKHFVCAVLFFFTLHISAQVRSSITITEKGKTYYIHTVAKGEGLYRISKTYDVTIDEIVNANPHLANESLKYGEELKIPQKQVDASTGAANNVTTNANGQIEHIIKPKETLYGISKQYDVSMEAIVALNPEVATTMRIGEKLIIPNKQQTIKQEISTPTNLEVSTEEDKETEETTIIANDNNHQSTIRIAYLLPFMTQSNRPDYKVTEFYQGALIAIKQAAEAGIPIEVYTYDTDKTTLKTTQISQEEQLKNCNLIIGPAYPNQIQPIAELAFQNHIHAFIPFTNKVNDISINPYLIQFNAEAASHRQAMAEYINKNEQNANIIFIHTVGQLNQDTKQLAELIKNKKITYSELEATQFPSRESIAEKLNENKKNIILIDAQKFADAQEWLKVLGQLGATYNICLLGDYGWLNYTSEIPVPMIFTSMFAPLSEANNYEAEYKKYYGELPPTTYPQYDVLGYDMTRFFIHCLTNNETSLEEQLPQTTHRGIITSPRYQRPTPTSGFINQRIYILQARQGNVSILQ